MSSDEFTVGIIGGEGKMGSFFSPIFKKYAKKVLISSETSQMTNKKLVEASDIVIVTVPMDITPQVICEISPYLTENQLIVDLTSLKTRSCEEMLLSKASVIGMHPMFGPSVGGLEDQKVVLCPVRPGNYLKWLKDLLLAEGAKVIETDPETHDKMMALIQALTHFTSLLFVDCLSKQGIDFQAAKEYASPVFQMQLAIAGRILSQNADLYASIQMENHYFPEVLQDLDSSLEELQKIIAQGDRGAFKDRFHSLGKRLGKLKEEGQKLTSQFITDLLS